GSFGTLFINKSITVSCETGTAGIFVPGNDNGISVQIAATDTVYLRGLDIERGSALGGQLPWGIIVNGGGGAVQAEKCLAGSLRGASITDSLASGNLYNGFVAKTADGKVTMMVNHSTASNNGASGARADGASAKLVLSNSVVSGNDTGVSTVNGGALLSYQDNRIDLNGTDGWPVPSLALH